MNARLSWMTGALLALMATQVSAQEKGCILLKTVAEIEQVTKDSDRDFWLTATEAADYGLVGRVIKRRAELEELAR